MYGAGNVVAGKYRIERVLGQGGMGYVVAATHLDLGTPVALKFLHEHMLENQSLVDRFKREARSSAQLRGENICRVSDVGTAENGQPYIVMELLGGQDLTSVLKERGALPVPMVAEIVQQACLALGEAHALGIVHRDLKPGNLMMTMRPDGTMCIKVLDFGVAKGPEDINFSLTQTASVIGSPGYMSPEQLKSSKTADVRSDIWSLGVVMYELVSGIKPFQGESITELALKVAMDPMPPLGGVVPWYFEQVITRCLEKEAARRYADVADLAVALAPFAGTRGHEMAHGVARVLRGAHTPLPVPPSAMQAPPTPAAVVQPPSNPTTLRGASGMVSGLPSRSRRNWKLPVILSGGAVLGVALALLVVRGHKHETSAASPESHAMSSPTPPQPTTPQPAPQATPTTAPAQDGAAKAKEEAEAKEQAAKDDAAAKAQAAKDEAAKAAAAKKEDELAKKEAAKEAAKQAAASAAAEKAELAKAEAAKKQAAREAAKEAAAKAAAEKKEQELAKRQAAREAAAKAVAAKAEAKKTASSSKSTKTSTTKTSTQSKDLGDSRF